MDWRPFEYSTCDSFENNKKAFTETVRFEPLPNGGTLVIDMLQAHMPLPRFIKSAMLKFVMINQHHFDKAFENATRMAGEEFAKTKSEEK